MKKEIAEQWIAALRSGDYKQGRQQLRSKNNEFCCLGVLCNLHAQAHPEIAEQQAQQQSYLNNSAYLPYQVRMWAGMHDRTGMPRQVVSVCGKISLSIANDDRISFDRIATFIENNYKLL